MLGSMWSLRDVIGWCVLSVSAEGGNDVGYTVSTELNLTRWFISVSRECRQARTALSLPWWAVGVERDCSLRSLVSPFLSHSLFPASAVRRECVSCLYLSGLLLSALMFPLRAVVVG
eukprot:scaffold126374_cov63-Attheya_sp.AAC.1